MNAPSSLPKDLAPKPRTLEDTGLSQIFVEELIAKHIHESGALDLRELSERLGLPGMVVESVINFMRDEARIEVRRRTGDMAGHYALTDKGHSLAANAMRKNSYIGPAPVTLEHYWRVVTAQTSKNHVVTHTDMQDAFQDAVVRDSMLSQLGPALHSGRAAFLYGPPGTGKSFIGRRLIRLFKDHVLVPHSLLVRDIVIPFFDPTTHEPVEEERSGGAALHEGYDERFELCRRPVVITGGELSEGMLEVTYDESRRQYRLPVQLAANNGVFMLDDLGRQRMDTTTLLNRWIVPMEEHRDYLYISGQHFAVPLDVVLVFSTNMNPLELVDDAFLRRIGYKVRFAHLEPAEYEELWRRVCRDKEVEYMPEVVRYVQEKLHKPQKVPLLPCHPRDLLNLSLDYCRYLNKPGELSIEGIEWAWHTYFVRLDFAEI